MQLDIVIPLYKSTETLKELIDRLNSYHSEKKNALKLHVIFVEDGGQDGTFELLLKLKSSMQFSFEAIRLMKNYGQHSAITVGLRKAKGDLVAVMDDDLQHDPFDIDELISKMEASNADLVYAAYKEKKHSLARNFASVILKKITKSKTIDFSDVTSFKVMRQSVLSSIKLVTGPVILVDVYLLEAAGKIETCKVNHAKRFAGKSTYSSRKLVKMTLNIVMFHSSLPLKMIVRLGIFISLICFGLSVYYVYQKFVNNVSVGFTSIIVSIFLSTGLILVSLGIIGEYIRKIWVQQNNLNHVLIAEHQV